MLLYLLTYLYLRQHSPGAFTNCVDHVSRLNGLGSLDTFTHSFLRSAWPKTRGPERGSRSALIVVAHVFSWLPVRLRYMRGSVWAEVGP